MHQLNNNTCLQYLFDMKIMQVSHVRVTQMNVTFLEYLWALMRHLHTLEIM
jgi:hypothetical protein